MTSLPRHSPGALFTKLFMLRSEGTFAGSFLVVEGDDDSRFWRRWYARDLCRIEIAGGRPAVEGIIARSDARRFPGTLGIVDADFSAIDGPAPSPNLLYTDHHDLEALLFQSSALDALLIHFGDAERVTTFEARAGHTVRDALLARGLPFGRLRWLSQRLSLGVPFDKLHPSNFLHADVWHLDTERLHDEASRLCGLTLADLHLHLDALPDAPSWALCQGHDLLAILNSGLNGVLAPKSPSLKALSTALHIAYQQHELHASHLYRDIRAWESRNPPYHILPPSPGHAATASTTS